MRKSKTEHQVLSRGVQEMAEDRAPHWVGLAGVVGVGGYAIHWAVLAVEAGLAVGPGVLGSRRGLTPRG